MSTSNFKDDILHICESLGEKIEAIVIERIDPYGDLPEEDYGSEGIPNYKDLPFGEVKKWEEVEDLLDFEYDSGYGTQECPNITAWTRNYVLFVKEYDGSTYVSFIRRHPVVQ